MEHRVGEPPQLETLDVNRESDRDTPFATFGVYDEGEGVRSLYIHPASAVNLGDVLLPFSLGGQIAVFNDHPLPPSATPLSLGGWRGPSELILHLQAPAELVLFGPDVPIAELERSLPSTLLACPEQFFVQGQDVRFAAAITDPYHAIIFSREPAVLRACLQAVFNHLLSESLDPQFPAPILPTTALDELIEPIAAEHCRLVRATERRRYRMLEMEILPAGSSPDVEVETWVADHRGGAWRAGWAW